MRHSYDLLLQTEKSGDPVPIAALVEALGTRGATLDANGRGLWKLAGAEVTVQPFLDEGALRGLDFHLPMLDRTDLLEAVCKHLIEVAEATKLRFMDPQRADTITLVSLGAAADEYLRMARYAGEYGGVSEALGLSSYARTPDDESSSMRWLLMLGVFLFALYVTWRAVTSWQERALAREAPTQVDLPPKVPGQ